MKYVHVIEKNQKVKMNFSKLIKLVKSKSLKTTPLQAEKKNKKMQNK